MIINKVRATLGLYPSYEQNPRRYWEKRGKVYYEQERGELEQLYGVGLRANFVAQEIIKLEPRNILEVGCGYGGILQQLTETGAWLVGCDFSFSQLRNARKYLEGKGVHLVYADATKRLPFVDNKFDLVFTSGVIMHIPSPEKVYEEMIRVSGKYVMHNESLTVAHHMFGHDNGKWYRDRGYEVKSRMNPYDADENMQFIVVGVGIDT